MHPNPAFRRTPAADSTAFAARRGFGTLCVNGAEGPLLAHVPFVLIESGASAELHLVRSNPVFRALREGSQLAVLAVSGPDGYVSPDWYGVEDQVPTWNYVAVHLRGVLAPLPAETLRAHLDRLSGAFEDRLAPKPPWTSSKMAPDALERMMRTIAPCRLDISAVDGTWKLNQNKAEPARLAAAANIAGGVGQGLDELAALMQSIRPPST